MGHRRREVDDRSDSYRTAFAAARRACDGGATRPHAAQPCVWPPSSRSAMAVQQERDIRVRAQRGLDGGPGLLAPEERLPRVEVLGLWNSLYREPAPAERRQPAGPGQQVPLHENVIGDRDHIEAAGAPIEIDHVRDAEPPVAPATQCRGARQSASRYARMSPPAARRPASRARTRPLRGSGTTRSRARRLQSRRSHRCRRCRRGSSRPAGASGRAARAGRGRRTLPRCTRRRWR